MNQLLTELKSCQICSDLPHGPSPVFQLNKKARLLLIGQAPGVKAHNSGIPWNDASGDRLRDWMGIEKNLFYDKKKIAILSMGMCYPGKGEHGDLPPRKECYEKWHNRLIEHMPELELILLVGSYAQKAYLKKTRKKNLSETVMNFKEYSPRFFPLPHPSPLNNIWLSKNKWFEKDILPELKQTISAILQNTERP